MGFWIEKQAKSWVPDCFDFNLKMELREKEKIRRLEGFFRDRKRVIRVLKCGRRRKKKPTKIFKNKKKKVGEKGLAKMVGSRKWRCLWVLPPPQLAVVVVDKQQIFISTMKEKKVNFFLTFWDKMTERKKFSVLLSSFFLFPVQNSSKQRLLFRV